MPDFHAKPTDARRASLAKCPACGRPFYINDGHRAYGSDACKQAAYRERKKAASRAAALARIVARAPLRTIARNDAGAERL